MRLYGLILMSLGLCWGQEYRSTITGQVADAQGAGVPKARVTAENMDSGTISATAANGAGQYSLSYLAPGKYRLSFEAAGFQKQVREALEVGTNQRLSLDVTLEVGSTSESVTVTAETPLLVTATASTGWVIDEKQVENMPLNGRSPLVLAQLGLGVVQQQELRQARPYDDSRQSNFSMGGAPSGRNEILLDGAPNTNEAGRVAYSPPVDSVTEVKVEVFQADAAYGNTGGGSINVTTKSGTNRFHGSAYAFNQVSALAATPFFTNASGQRKPVTRYNQWGVSAGGPVWLPKLFNGRNRLFFHFSYEGIKTGLPVPRTVTVPNAAERTGDFSSLLRLGAAYQLYDPATGTREGTRVRRMPFAGNVIPASRIDPVARKIVDFYGAPNQPGSSDDRNNFFSSNVTDDRFHSETGRLDYNVTERHKLFFNSRHNARTNKRDNYFNNVANGTTLNQINYGATLDHVWTLSPVLVANTRLNWSRNIEDRTIESEGYNFAELGLPAALAAQSPKLAFPVISPNGYQSLGSGDRVHNPFDIFQVFATMSKFTGSHNVKFGGDLRLTRFSSVDFENSAGSYSFGNNWTVGPLDNSPAAPKGQGLATLLLGLPTGGSFGLNSAQTATAKYAALFVQDDWRVNSGLTLNLGLRYERDLATRERFNRSVNGFDFATESPVSRQAAAAYARSPIPELPVSQFRTVGGLVYASEENPRLYDTGSNFSPRFGVAWKPRGLGGKTVIRGGTGMFVFPIGKSSVDQTGFSQSTPVVSTLDGNLTPATRLANPFPGGLLQPTGSSLGIATNLGRGVGFPTRERENAYSLRWSFDVQRELPKSTVVQIGYLGNRGENLTVSRDLNYVPAQYLSTSPVREQAVIDRLTANVANPFAGLLPGTGLDGSTVQRQQLLRPYPHFTGVSQSARPEGNSWYHAILARADKRLAQGIQVTASYQFGKLMERRSRLNDQDAELEKRIAGEDRPQRLILSGRWDVPFAKRSRLLGGWSLSTIYTWQDGPALNWGNVIYLGGDLNLDPRGVDGAFDVTRFNRTAAQQLAQNLRTFSSRFGNLRADGINNMDFAAIKNTRITEGMKLQFRSEFFNLLNLPTFEGPQLSPTNTTFGRITSQANLSRSIQLGLRLVW